MTDKDAYTKKLEAQMKEWQANIDKLRAQAEKAQADSQIEYERQLKDLRSRRDELHEKLSELQKNQSAAWNDIKAGADKAWDDMSKAMQDAWKRFG
ncbi:hypothetical protein [Roseovarius atlanticus]|uniref:hypothetical protein n=1 Tax=Roseovarius atlanticus TaxID=1641875 RepID=UPI001C94E755|nr:hypothetical protein [Roseovarius atlanticus]MBY5986760.1 hypothetical protein [Roseovarius atlanticus]MBY6125400.1 hypothetical protein [Roseovarius atlanticus]MBY6150139.1 hypothetical protein [Roseovarius atlanticus]